MTLSVEDRPFDNFYLQACDKYLLIDSEIEGIWKIRNERKHSAFTVLVERSLHVMNA